MELGDVHVRGQVLHEHYRVITVQAPSVANALAALALRIRDDTGAIPNIYFEWTEGNPVQQFLRFLLFGVGEVAPVTPEVLRCAEPDPHHRPRVHVGEDIALNWAGSRLAAVGGPGSAPALWPHAARGGVTRRVRPCRHPVECTR